MAKGLREVPIYFNQMDGGVNYSLPQNIIPNNDLAGALNFFYDPLTGRPMNRPGVTRYSTNGVGTNPNGGFYSAVLDKDLVAESGTLYYLNSSKAYVSIGALNGSAKPHFLDFNGKVLIASGGIIQSTDGVTISNVANAPVSYKIMGYAGRVVSAGDPSYPYRISLCAPGDETTWSTSSPADGKYFDIELKIGNGLTDFNVLANDIVCFYGPEQKGITRLIIPENDFSNAYTKQDSQKSTSINWHSSYQASNNLYFLDYNGWKSLKGVINYGDIEQDPIGEKINAVITPTIDKNHAFMFGNPYYSQVWLRFADVQTIYVFHYVQNKGKGAFMPIQFQGLDICSAWYHEGGRFLLIGMSDGYVYKFDPTVFTDNGATVPAYIRTKRIALGGKNMIKKLTQTMLEFEAVAPGTIVLESLTNAGNNSASISGNITDEVFVKLYDATTLLNVATDPLYGQTLQTAVSNKMVWHYDLQYLLTVNSGGMKLNGLECLVRPWGKRQS
jgi:hypothetical protein